MFFTWLTVFRKDGLGLLSLPRILFGPCQSYFAAICAVSRDLASLCKNISLLEVSKVISKMNKIQCFHSRGQHLCKFIESKEGVCIRKEFNFQRSGRGHQYGCRASVRN